MPEDNSERPDDEQPKSERSDGSSNGDAAAATAEPAGTVEAKKPDETASPAPSGPTGKGKKKSKGRSAKAPGTDGPSPASTADAEAKADGDAASGDTPLFPKAPTFKPAAIKLRDVLLVGVPGVLLGWLMLFRGDVINPFGEDPAHRLGHYQALLHSGHVPGGVIIGFVCVVLMVLGLLGLLGDSPLDLRGDEALPSGFDARPVWWKREGFWLIAFCVALYVPLAGAYGLWDPWETHYSEVAREVLARDDWITLWWGQEGWFMSKPILIFWMAALGMGFGSTFGLPFWRDQGPASHEWYIRLPIVFLAIAAVYAIYRAVSAAWGRRAGLVAGMVLATMPHWCFLAHQAMTDMPFVAPLVIAISFLMLAVVGDPEKLVAARPVKLFGRTFRISFWHLAVGAILMMAVPQILYLLTRPMMVACPDDADASCRVVLNASRIGPLQFPIERYWSGSAGNSVFRDVAATVPGSPAWEDRYNQISFFTSFLQGLIWLVLGFILMLSFRRERRHQALCFAMVYLFGAISFMGKGPAGLGVPEIVLLGFMITTGRWRLLPRIRLFQGIGIFLLCGFPWYIAIYCRLGNEYFDRFVVHDLLNRAFAGVHGDTGTFRYFVWQLGYAMFPWTGLVPAALAGWKLYVPEHATEQQKDVARLSLIWFMVTFTLFSLMVTKFHHYIFPAVPSVAVLVGLLVHRLLGDTRLRASRESVGSMIALTGGVAALVLGVTNFFGAWHGRVSHEAPYRLPPGNTALAIVLLGVGLAALIYSFILARRAETPLSAASDAEKPSQPAEATADGPGAKGYRDGASVAARGSLDDTPYMQKYGAVGLGAVGVAGAVLLALVTRDIGNVGTSRPAGFERFIHLFIYNYDRPFPTRSYDYHAILSGFGIVAVIAAALIAFTALRRHAARMMIALAACFGFWALDKYMIDLSNHWSQRNLFVKYYTTRHERQSISYGEDARYWSDAIVAYQMNWKGENFYTGNHAAMLECGLPLCHERTNEWLTRHRGERVFFVTELSRSSSIIGQIRQSHPGADAHAVTDEYDNNKFVLVEAQL